jgi:phospholipid/cholesterol/gamma-HCH transport system substrate-binding protein
VLATTDEAAKKVGHLSANADDLVSETKGEIKQSVARLNQTLEATDDTAKRIAQLTADADDVIAASKAQIKQGTAQFAQLMAQSRVLVDSLTRLSNDIQRQPTELLFGDRREGYKPK